jgi:alpha-tubulin suppressor-like RCC1 family protein
MTIDEHLRIRTGEWVIIGPLPQPPVENPPSAEPPPPPAPPPKVVEVSSGTSHTCARYDDGNAKCWGNNGNGRLGSAGGDTSTPRAVGLTGIAQISAGGSHTCAVRTDTTLWCWGSNSVGQLGSWAGYGTQSSHPDPRQVMVGASPLTDVAQVSAGDTTTCAVTRTNRVWCFGFNSFGQFGSNVAYGGSTATPTQIQGLVDATQVSLYGTHACARRSNGAVSCWGDNGMGQVGDAAPGDHTSPFSVGGALVYSNGVAAGKSHSCSVTWNSRLQCWGWNFHGQLGNAAGNSNNVAAPNPTEIANLWDAQQVTGGGFHTCVRTTTSRVKCWGDNKYGQMGSVTADPDPNPTPALVPNLTGVVAVDAGEQHTCAFDSSGRVWCWGQNFFGQLGKAANVGTLNTNIVPTQVAGL